MNSTFKMASLVASLGVVGSAFAGAPDPFTPLDKTFAEQAPLGQGLTNPWHLPAGFTATLIVDANTLEANTGGAFPDNLRNWDMIEVNPLNTNQIFFTNETDDGGVVRYDRSTGQATVLLNANLPARLGDPQVQNNAASFNPLDDTFVDLDGIRFTSYGSIIFGEEEQTGRLFEITNPATATGTADANVRFLDRVPAVRHEGMDFDAQGNLYFVDELNSGSIYKFVPTNTSDLSQGGTTYALVDDSFVGEGGIATEDFNSAANAATDRTGSATWVAITDAAGTAPAAGLTQDPFDYVVTGTPGGQDVADEVNATPYGRPEDLHLVTLDNGNQALVVATTSENITYSIELTGATTAEIREFVNSAVTPNILTGLPVGAGASDTVFGHDDPDNLAIGPNGEVYIIEDEASSDIFVATDVNNDGVAESVALWASTGEEGSELTGLFLDPADPTGRTFLVNIQHPDSGNDALWSITVPEPTSLALLAVGGLMVVRRRRG